MKGILFIFIFFISFSMALAANCTNRDAISSSCQCNGATVSTGYCCYYDPAIGNISYQATQTCGYTKYSPHWQNLRLFIVHYVSNEPTSATKWVAENFDIAIGGPNLLQYNPNIEWTGYIDSIGPSYLDWFITVKDVANDKGLVFEDGVAHVVTDFLPTYYASIRNPDAFDTFETPNSPTSQATSPYGYNGVKGNGVVVFHAGAYNDESIDAYSVASNDVPYCQSANDFVYMGYEEPFDEINYLGSGSSFTAQFEYYDGSIWKVLTPSQDTTNLFKQNGQVRFIPPADWDVVSINGKRAKYFIRLHCLTVTTQPTASRIYGNDYYAGNPSEIILNNARYNFKLRGFNATAPGVVLVTKQNIKYNPNPPAASSARFQYWARIPFSFGFAMNTDANTATSKFKVWVEGITNLTIDEMKKNSLTGMMYDDAQQSPSTYSGISPSNTDYGTGNNLLVTRNQYMYDSVKAVLPNAYLGQNNYNIQYIPIMEFQLREDHISDTLNFNPNIEYFYYQNFTAQQAYDGGYDNYIGFSDGLMYYSENVLLAGDHIDRGPMAALAAHYIGMNALTPFGYHSHGTSYGYETQGVICTDGTQVYAYDCTGHGSIKQYNSWFPAIAVEVGTPTSNRYVWQTLAGGNIYRRNFTNGIVLMRGGNYGSSVSPSYALDGSYYKVHANGSLEGPINSIALKDPEGVVLISNSTSSFCALPYDTTPCDCISGSDLSNALSAWYANTISISQLMAVIKQWKLCSN